MTSVARVNGADKRVINARTDVNQLVPFAHRWAWDKYLQACNNHWMPSEFPVVPSLWHEIGRKHKAILLDAMALRRWIGVSNGNAKEAQCKCVSD